MKNEKIVKALSNAFELQSNYDVNGARTSAESVQAVSTPWNAFLELSGYLEQVLSIDSISTIQDYAKNFGYVELCALAECLAVFENHGYEEVYKNISLMMFGELKGTEEMAQA